MQNTLSNRYETPQPPLFKSEHSNSQFRASSAGGSGAAGSVALLRTFVEQARANAARFEAKLDAALQKLDEILAQLASQDRKLDHITDQLARLQEPSPGLKADRGAWTKSGPQKSSGRYIASIRHFKALYNFNTTLLGSR